MSKKRIAEQVLENLPHRRDFVKRLGLAGAAGAALAGNVHKANAQAMITDVDIVNFALNLEYLEAEFYTLATTGMTIEQMGIGITGSGTPGLTTGGKKVNLFNQLVFTSQIALQIAADERAHVTFLRNALQSLGAEPVAKPAINLNALGIGFNSQNEFLVLARAFEDIGVTAYGGAAPLIQSPQVLAIAARIFGTEAEHAANIRLQVARLRIPTTPLDGVDVIPPPSGSLFFSVDGNALVQTRTPGQVLFLTYGNRANATSGGFFPNGVNGPINTSTTSA